MPTTTRSCPAAPNCGSTINVPAIDLRKLGDEEQNLLPPLALAPKGIWFAPKDLRLFYQVRQNWRGKAVLVKLIWRMFRARVFGDRMAAIGQSLAARMRLALKEQNIPLWLDSPMTELITDVDGDGDRGGRRAGRRSSPRIGARRGVDPGQRRLRPRHGSGAGSICPCSRRTGASAIPRRWATASGRARRSAAPPTCSTRHGGSPPCAGPTAGCSSCSTSG